MVAYANNDTSLSSAFTTTTSPGSAFGSVWGTWRTEGVVHTNCGPQTCKTPSPLGTLDQISVSTAQTDTTPNHFNQCVFIRYYTMRKRALRFPKLIKAGAGPHDLGSGNNSDELLPELTVQSSSNSDTGSYGGGDSTTDYSSSITSYESGLEVYHNVSSVCQPWFLSARH